MKTLTSEEKKTHRKQKTCYMCKNECNANNKKYQKVREYSHYTEKYRGAAHVTCNLRYKGPAKGTKNV